MVKGTKFGKQTVTLKEISFSHRYLKTTVDCAVKNYCFGHCVYMLRQNNRFHETAATNLTIANISCLKVNELIVLTDK